MTTQIPDEVYLDRRWFAITAVDGAGLWDPAEHGLDPEPSSTGCYRGFVCRYAITEGRLVLRELALGEHDQGRQDLAVAFTGRLLLGRAHPAEDLCLNTGFRPAWQYREVRELTLRDGHLITATDCSAELAAVRAEILAAGQPPGRQDEDWVGRTFSLAYDYSWPGR